MTEARTTEQPIKTITSLKSAIKHIKRR